MTLAQANREDREREQYLEESAKRYRDSQIGMRYTYCKCGYECRSSQYGTDDYCPRCGEQVNWKGAGI